MDFSNEYYVRLYVRDTTTWKRLGWHGQAVFTQVLRKVDRSGVLDIEDMEPWEAVVLHCGAPEDAAREGVAACLRLGVLQHNDRHIVAPKYREANEAKRSDAQRQREFRAGKALDKAATPGIGKPQSSDTPLQNVTPGHDATEPVTASHTESHEVTLTSALPCPGITVAVAEPATEQPPPPDPEISDPAHAADPPEHLLSTHHVENAWHDAAHAAGAMVVHGESSWRSQYATVLEAVKLAVPVGRRLEALRAVCAWFWSAPDGPVASKRVPKPTPAQLAKGISNDLASAYEWWQSREAAQ